MFTGIIEEVGRIKSTQPGHLTICSAKVMEDLKNGDSICVNGVCLTVTSRQDVCFTVDVVPETLRRTNLGVLEKGNLVNLERSLAVNSRFGGHFVQGHVEGTGKVGSMTLEGESLLIEFQAHPSVMHYIVEKGFIAVDGVSLTVVTCDRQSFMVSVIPYTRDNTTLETRKVGEYVNLETDILAKYVARLLSGQNASGNMRDQL